MSETRPATAQDPFATALRQAGWQEPSPEVPRLEREAAAIFLSEARRLARAGDAAACAIMARVAAAIVREGELASRREAEV